MYVYIYVDPSGEPDEFFVDTRVGVLISSRSDPIALAGVLGLGSGSSLTCGAAFFLMALRSNPVY